MQRSLPDFDQLMWLANNDPEALEEIRREEVEALIASATPDQQPRLRGLQFQIDAQRRIHNNSLGVCMKVSHMMHESFDQLRELLINFSDETALVPISSRIEPEEPAKVLPFPD